jgi:competence protein ComEC
MLKHPMLPVALLYSGGVVLADWLDAPLWLLFSAGLGLGLSGLIVDKARVLGLAGCLVLAGWINMTSRTAVLSGQDLRSITSDRPQKVVLRGCLRGVPSQRVHHLDDDDRWRTLVPVEVSAIRFAGSAWSPARGMVQTSTVGQALTNLFDGQAVEVEGVLAPPAGAQAEGLFNYKAYLARVGIHRELRVESPAAWQATGRVLPAPWTERFRRWAQSAMALGLPEHDLFLDLQWTMLLGWKTGMSGEVAEPFMRSGTMHVFAISGLHIALFASIFVGLFRLANIPRGPCGLAVIGLIWFYTAATEWQASAIRSTVMMTVVLAGWSLKRPSNLLNSLAAAALLILLWDPSQLLQASFQLSFSAVLGLALSPSLIERSWRPVMRRIEAASLQSRWNRFTILWTWWLPPDPFLPSDLQPRWQRWLRNASVWTGKALTTSLAATIGTAPLIAYHFHLFSPISLVTNMLVVPLSGGALASGVGGLLCAGWLPWVTECFNHAGWFLMSCMVKISRWGSEFPGAWWSVAAPGPWFLALYYLTLACVMCGLLADQHRRWVLASLATLATAWLATTLGDARQTRLTVLPAGRASAVWVDSPGIDRDWLLDCGDTFAAARTTIPFLRSQGVNRLEHFALTHGDARHVGGATNVMLAFLVDELCTGPLPMLSQPYRQAIAVWTNSHGPIRLLRAGDKAAPWRVLHPAVTNVFGRADDKALVMLGEWQGTRVLICPDLGPRGQSALLSSGVDLRADIVITSPSTEGALLPGLMLERVQPQVVILSESRGAFAGDKERALMRRLVRAGIKVVWLAESGAATVRCGRRGWTLEAMDGFRWQGVAQ